MSYFHFVAVSIFYAFSRVMDSKWGGKTETINMKLNVEQVQNKMTMKLKQMTHMHNFKQLLDEVFVISGIIKVEGSVISRSRRLRLITLTETSSNFSISCWVDEANRKAILTSLSANLTLLSVHLTL